MLRTISLGENIFVAGRFVRDLADGRIEIRTRSGALVGIPTRQAPTAARRGVSRGRRRLLAAAPLAALAFALPGAPEARAAEKVEILNVSYDPTREFYRRYNELFAEWWAAQGHGPVTIKQSHGGSGGQARAVIDGLQGTVATLALSADIDAIAGKTGKIPADWQSRLPHNASPYTSTIVFLVREGNPKGVKDWDDLARDDVQVVTPNPKTSGGARWNFLAAWGWAQGAYGGDEAKTRAYMKAMFRNVPVLDTGARGSTTTFVQRGIGDVLLAWENEALLALAEQGGDAFEIVVPSVSMLAEPPVALIEGNIRSDAQRAAAQAYLEHLYSPEAQAIALQSYYRAWDTSAASAEDLARFPEVKRLSIDDFGGWAKVQPAFFGDGGVFDQIYAD